MHLCLTHTRMHQTSCVPSSNTHSNRLWNVGTTWRPVLFSFDSVHFPLGTSKENICVWNTLKVQGIIHFWASWWKKIFFYLSSACVFIRESKQMPDCVHDNKKKREFGVCVCVIFCVRAFNTFLLLFSCSLHTVVFGPGRWLSKKQKNGGAGTNRRRVCEYDVCACLFAGKKS